jgi:hypothetical protein
VRKRLTEEGDFRSWDVESEWTCQADLEREVMKYMGEAPAESTIRSRIAPMIERWRETKRQT